MSLKYDGGEQYEKQFSLDTGILKVMLVTSAYSADGSAHRTLDDVASGVRLGSSGVLTNVQFKTNGFIDADDTTVTCTAAGTIHAAILYADTGTGRLISYHNNGGSGFGVAVQIGFIIDVGIADILK